MLNLAHATPEERQRFLDSFDTLMADCDGTVWTLAGRLKGADVAMADLQRHGKKIVYVTNNTTRDEASYNTKFKLSNFNATFADVIHPGTAAVDYLRSKNFQGAIYVIGSTVLKNLFTDAGLEVIDDSPWEPIDESVPALWKYISAPTPVAAVFIDVDFNLTMKQLMRAQLMLSDPNCEFIVGLTDMAIHLKQILLGPGRFASIIGSFIEQTPVVVGKPGAALRDIIFAKFQITDPQRVLFVGDAFDQDIGFGKLCGFQTLAVTATGVITEKSLLDHPVPSELPDYYLPSFADLAEVLAGLRGATN